MWGKLRRDLRTIFAAGALASAGGCGGVTPPPPGSTPLAQAVVEREPEAVAALLAAGAPADSSDERGRTALLLATVTNQYRVANLLLDHGANLWFADRLGFTPAAYAEFSRLEPTSDEGLELARFIRRLREAGHPWPPPGPDEVVALRNAGRWPPRR